VDKKESAINYILLILSLVFSLLVSNFITNKYYNKLIENKILDQEAFSSDEKKNLKEEYFSKNCFFTSPPIYKKLYFFNISLSENCKKFSSTRYDRDLILRTTIPYEYNHLNEYGNSNEIPEIWFFGGSTLQSYYTSDINTIPSVVAQKLKENKISSRVINFGKSGLNLQYELSNLLSVMNSYSNKPKIVIFYDGYNDSLTSMAYGGDHINIALTIGKYSFSKKEQLFLSFNELVSDHSYLYNKGWSYIKYTYYKKRINLDNFSAEESSQNYINSVYFASIFLDNLNIKKYFFLQPMTFSRDKLIGNEINYTSEENIKNGKKIYNLIKKKMNNNDSFIDLSKIFDEKSYGQLFYDGGHLGDIGNNIVGNKIAEIIINDLKE